MTMLDRMRRHNWWLKWSLGLVVLTFIVFFIPADFMQPTSSVGANARDVIAEVDGREITAGDFQTRYLSQVQAYRAQLGANASDQLLRQLGIERQILTQMIDEQVALIEAERLGIRVSDDELAQQIFSIPGLQENGQFIGEARYEQLLMSQNPPLTKAQFEDNLRRALMLDKLRAAMTDWMAVGDAEVEREYRRRNEKVKLQVVALTADQFRDKVTVTDPELAAHFEAHKEQFRVGEQRKVKYLLLDRDQARQKVTVPQADIQRFYDNNIQQYQTPEQVRASHILLKTEGKDEAAVRAQAEQILKQVQAGADFAALARKVSEDEGSKANGGDLDYFGRGRMVPEFENAAFSMQPGQTSDLVKTQYGFHIIKVVDKRPASTRSLDEVRADIQDRLAWEIAERQLADQARQLQGRIKTAADLTTVAGTEGLTVQDSGFFQRQDPVPGLGPAPEVAEAAFRLNPNEVSGPINSPRGTVFVAFSEKRDAYVPKFEEVKERVREDFVRVKAADLSRQQAASIAASLKAAPDFAAAAKSRGLTVKDTELITRGSPLPDIGVSPEVEKAAFALPVGAVSDPIVLSTGTVIVRVVEHDEATAEELKQARDAFRAELLNERRSRFFGAFMAKAKERRAIEINNETLQRLTTALQS